jgi:dTDP-4-dehydrorhamnose 3,5-epimerase
MEMRVEPTALDGVLLVYPGRAEDERGFFMESYRRDVWAMHGLTQTYVQDNHSRSKHGVIRGLHYQDARAPQHRVVRCTMGEVFDVVVDLRMTSKTFGQWIGLRLSADVPRSLIVPPEFGHGFAVLSTWAEMQYKASGLYCQDAFQTIAWDDRELAIPWPVADPVLTDRDRHDGLTLAAYRHRPHFS